MCRYVSRSSRITLSILRVEKGIRNPFADTVIATVVLEAGDSGAKENTVCSQSGMYRLIRSFVLQLTDRQGSRVQADFTFGKPIDVRCRNKGTLLRLTVK